MIIRRLVKAGWALTEESRHNVGLIPVVRSDREKAVI
jgi:hypothetical protein